MSKPPSSVSAPSSSASAPPGAAAVPSSSASAPPGAAAVPSSSAFAPPGAAAVPPSSVSKPIRVVAALVLLVAAAAVLLLWPDTATTTAKSKFVSPGAGLTVAYDDSTGEIGITAIGYRKKSVAQVRVGSNPWQDVRADDNGTVKLTVMLGARPGLSGTSVLVSGRSASAGSRTLIGGLPPAASARGGVDLAPYAMANVLVVLAVITAFGHRPRRGRHRRTRKRLRELARDAELPHPAGRRDAGFAAVAVA